MNTARGASTIAALANFNRKGTMLTKSQKWVFDCFRLALQRHPELRVGQLIVNALDGKYSGGLFSLSDGQFGRLLLDYRPERIPW